MKLVWSVLMEQYWIAIFATFVFVPWASAENWELYKTPSGKWEWDTSKVKQISGVYGWRHPTSPGSPKNRYTVCDVVDPVPQEPNSWLLSKFIHVGGVQRVDVTVRYSITPCSTIPSVNKFCKNFFNVYVWESDNQVTSDQVPNPIKDNSPYRRFANISSQTSGQKTLTIPLQIKRKFTVLGFRDQGGCRTLFSVKVTYNVCPGKTLTDSLVSLPQTLAPSNDLQSIQIEGRCISDSVHVQGSLSVLCESSGEWNTSRLEGRCICKENMQNTGGTCTASNCSAAWVRYRNSCFYIDDTPTEKQAEARTACQNMGADLPIIRSADSNKFLFDLVKKQRTVTHLGAWLGIHRKEADSKLYWIDGTPLEGQYQNWQLGEPNNYGNDEYCAQMFGAPGTWKVEPGKWNDLPCDFRAGNNAPVVLCQKTI